MIPFILAIFITNQSQWYNSTANQVWNTTGVGGNLGSAPNIIIANIPWFFPLITLVFMLFTDYILGIKNGVDKKTNIFAVALVYTVLAYLEVIGSLSTSNWFYIFEIIMIATVFFLTLFGKREE